MSVPDPALTDWVPIYAGSPAFTYRGDYVPATQYNDGDIVMYNGTPWLAVKNNNTPPDPFPLPLNKIAYGTSLPASPVDGQEAILVDSLTAPTYQWRFRYNAGSTSPYKWEFIGGAPKTIVIEASTGVAVNDGAWREGVSLGPEFLIPRTGVYTVQSACRSVIGGGSSAATGMCVANASVSSGPPAGSGLYAAYTSSAGYMGSLATGGSMTIQASQTMRQQYFANAPATFDYRSLIVIPVRVS